MILIGTAVTMTARPAAGDPISFSGRAQIVDADTLRVDGAPKDVRLFGIDAPEKAQTCTDAAGALFLCGAKAAEAMSEILGRNPRVTCKVTDVDRYGRLVARCSSNAVDISGELVRQGWALDFTRYSGGAYEAQEEEARDAKRGLWAGDFEEPSVWRAKKRAESGR